MENIIPMEAAAALLRAAETPMVGTQGNRIVFANPAAVSVLGANPTGQSAASIFPERLIRLQSGLGAMSCRIRNRNAVVTMTGAGLWRIYAIRFDPPARRVPPPPSPQLQVLADLRMAAEMLKAEEGLSGDRALHAARIMKACYQLQRWFSNVGTLASLQEGSLPFQPMETDCTALLRHLSGQFAPLAERRQIRVATDLPEECVAAADPVLLERMLMNLLSNSLLHCEAGSRIRMGLAETGKELAVTVQDTGSGIPPEQMGSLFTSYDLYAGGDRGGGGCGLPVALGITRLHGGDLLLDTTPGVGTTVTVLLPNHHQGRLKLRADAGQVSFCTETDFLISMADALEPEELL